MHCSILLENIASIASGLLQYVCGRIICCTIYTPNYT